MGSESKLSDDVEWQANLHFSFVAVVPDLFQLVLDV